MSPLPRSGSPPLAPPPTHFASKTRTQRLAGRPDSPHPPRPARPLVQEATRIQPRDDGSLAGEERSEGLRADPEEAEARRAIRMRGHEVQVEPGDPPQKTAPKAQ